MLVQDVRMKNLVCRFTILMSLCEAMHLHEWGLMAATNSGQKEFFASTLDWTGTAKQHCSDTVGLLGCKDVSRAIPSSAGPHNVFKAATTMFLSIWNLASAHSKSQHYWFRLTGQDLQSPPVCNSASHSCRALAYDLLGL